MSAKKHFKSKREERLDKKQQRRVQLVSIFLVILMMASMAAIALYGGDSSGETYRYKNHKFVADFSVDLGITYFSTKIDKQEIEFYSLPQETLYLSKQGELHTLFKNAQAVIFSFDQNDMLAPIFEFTRFRFIQYAPENMLIGAGILIENETSQFPLVTCVNSSINTPVITLEQGNDTTIAIQENGCVVITTLPELSLQVSDHLLYSLVGIINEEE